MKRVELLKQMSFGEQVAEDEVNELASYFVETNQWDKIVAGQIDMVRGEKGGGKSAIYALLMSKADEFFDKGILLVPAEASRGQTVFKDLADDPPTSETEFVALWKLYILTLVAQQLREYEVKHPRINEIYDPLTEAGLLQPQFSLRGLLRVAHDLAKRLVKLDAVQGDFTIDPNTGAHTYSGKIVLREPTREQKLKGYITVDRLIEIVDAILEGCRLRVWILLDRLDVAFVENHQLEENALRALVRAYGDIKASNQISLKIFLREDIWKRITERGMREASHLTKYVVLDWTQPTLLNLVVRRILNNQVLLKEFNLDKDQILKDATLQEELFYRFFPAQVEQGTQKSPTFNWLVRRCADGSKRTAPRELIHLLRSILDEEIKQLERGRPAPDGDQLFDRSVFKAALPIVSGARLHTYLYAEYPNEREFVAKLEGQKTEQTPESLAELWGMDRANAVGKANRLVDLGVFEERGTREQPTYWVPFLYRDALKLVQGRAEADEE
ncbi:conserved hypothetical protein [Mesorhizobium metallidurans STM 2683]|uniref:Uncharacterized protein n=1 Tax=Mesorhizobium metallidurans STM 2683 TaxID=1297569 RepID=M5EFV6_9HYPH|nr:hypothetical protein [Mesorhizobium metallidurans]CCV03449.1 conserved hypothetical protein [Mesorhizobium metallidurans STM 2683]